MCLDLWLLLVNWTAPCMEAVAALSRLLLSGSIYSPGGLALTPEAASPSSYII